ncbi:hypothetical protein N825_28105 [Skermanella stibiiresistens SB22]|uniref:PRTase-CE domain-containing protein n=1 Tax=Skermanella stibiiresistens SB22 TaxID=1385369 RepID=W9H630_9PROT|nr:hypothetical protein N825_28105 [Skermanella stibiiresistens SB22]
MHSKAVSSLLEVLLDDNHDFICFDDNRRRNVKLIVDKIALAIVGQTIDDRLPLLHEIISGPFDADKLDYFVRDARMAGTPSVLDISRLVQKISIRRLESSKLPEEIARKVGRSDEHHYLFGMKWSGVPVLDELHLARVLLYAKIYRHPKVVAIEQMLRAAILAMAKVVPVERVLELVYTYDDDALLSMTVGSLHEALRVAPDGLDAEARERLEQAIGTLKAIKARKLTVLAFQIQRRYPADPLEKNDIQKSGLTSFLEDVEHPQSRESFRTLLIDEVRAILGVTLGAAAPSRIDLETSIMIHTLGQTPGGSQIARAFLLPVSGSPLPFREYTVNRTAWADAYMSNQPTGYVFAKPAIADAVYLAVEKLLRIRHMVRLPPSALEGSKRGADRIEALKRRLWVAGYYDDAPYDIRPKPERLAKADVIPIVERFAELLAKYQEPCADARPGPGEGSLRDRVLNWLRQFDHDGHVDCALSLLKRFRMIDRSDTVGAIKGFIARHPSFSGAVVVPFGSARDSGAIQTYYSADLIGSGISSCMTIEEAAKKGGETPIIVVDDFVASGGQGQDILAAGFGLTEWRKSLGEQRELFDDEVQAHLRKIKIGFVFTAAWDEGIETIERMAREAGMDAIVHRHIDESGIPFAFDGRDDPDPAAWSSFKARCEEIGGSLLGGGHNGVDAHKAAEMADRVAKRRLGYGNRAMLLGSPFNIPAQTLTLFWEAGKVDGVDWTPLMARRKKT